ncbi:MAG TPA: glycoside hydrolase family 57 protein [Candidatus Dormibacteraeota bacterium]|nr:glycoside hydrolase family 57 protein [Candidatus Dormibacteraeota bacterium]
MNGQLPIAIVWHMHQPYYRHPQTSEVVLPWVRLHAAKDYLHMARLLHAFPNVKVNFTLVPALHDQLEEVARGEDDADARLTLRSGDGGLSVDDRQHLLRRFFSISHQQVVHRIPDYARLHNLRLAAGDRPDLLSSSYFRDLAAWFNLAWIDPELLTIDERLVRLRDRGRNFSRDDLQYILSRHRNMASGVVRLYHRLQKAGQVEVVTVPAYHPILPLLIDSDVARRSDPGAILPQPPFRWPEDAEAHVVDAVRQYERVFDRKPTGLWPSEGAVSPEVSDIIAKHGVKWFATDEGVLAASIGAQIWRDDIGALQDPALLYRPYRLSNGTTILFRDRELSDRIGFAYGHMSPADAVAEMITRLARARDRLSDGGGPYLAAIILDGENAWEGYTNNGNEFLRALYGALNTDQRFTTVRVSEFLEQHPAQVDLPRLHSGSWIDANYRVWIGEESHLRAWNLLGRTRAFAAEQWGALGQMPANVARALMVAEGSDWFWWYSSRNSSPEDLVFDELFRANLEVVWWWGGTEPPAELRQPLTAPQAAPVGGAMLPGRTG